MSDWNPVRIEDIAIKIAMGPFGSNIKVNTFLPAGVPIISGQHLHGSRLDETPGFNFISEEHAEQLANSNVFPGDVVFTHAGTIGQVALIPQTATYDRYVISQRQFYLRVDISKADPDFVTHWFHSPIGKHRLLMHASQVGVPSISRPVSNLKAIEIKLPSLYKQKAISEVFGVLDDKIDLNRRTNETLESMARAIFKDWFVDFGPTRAKAEGRVPYLAPEICGLFPEDLDDGDKPRGWETNRLDSLFDISIGRTPPRKEQHHFVPKGRGRTWISIKDMAGVQTFIFSSEEDLTPTATETFRVPLILADTVVVSFKLTVGRVAISAKEMHSNEAIAHLNRTPLTPVETEYTYCFMSNFDYESLASTSSIATAVNSKSIKAIEMLVPDGRVHSVFVDLVNPIFRRIKANNEESKCLAETRDLLLPKLMSGEIRLREAEKAVEAVA